MFYFCAFTVISWIIMNNLNLPCSRDCCTTWLECPTEQSPQLLTAATSREMNRESQGQERGVERKSCEEMKKCEAVSAERSAILDGSLLAAQRAVLVWKVWQVGKTQSRMELRCIATECAEWSWHIGAIGHFGCLRAQWCGPAGQHGGGWWVVSMHGKGTSRVSYTETCEGREHERGDQKKAPKAKHSWGIVPGCK